jgi:hypothetical protein
MSQLCQQLALAFAGDGIVDDSFHDSPHFCNTAFFIKEDLHNPLHVLFSSTLCILLPVNIEERSLYVNGEGKVHCVYYSLRDASVGVKLTEICGDGSAIKCTWEQ